MMRGPERRVGAAPDCVVTHVPTVSSCVFEVTWSTISVSPPATISSPGTKTVENDVPAPVTIFELFVVETVPAGALSASAFQSICATMAVEKATSFDARLICVWIDADEAEAVCVNPASQLAGTVFSCGQCTAASSSAG